MRDRNSANAETDAEMIVVTLYKTSSSRNMKPHDSLFLLFVREADRVLYDEFVRGTITAWDLLTKLRELDPELRYPTGDGLPFVHLLAAVGKDEPPKPFIDLLK